MAILKQAKNIFINVRETYKVQAGQLLEQSSGLLNVESLKENLSLNSGKQVKMKGTDGIQFQDYTPPKIEVVESEYKLVSTFAMEQLFAAAEKDSMAMFCLWMADIFGSDISVTEYRKLYKDTSDKKDTINPKITVAVSLPGKGAAYISDPESPFKNHIIVSQGFIESAMANKKDSNLLLIALVEEFGHHLDYLLRFEYGKEGGDAPGDEGAKYTARLNRKYRKFYIDLAKEKNVHYATATLDSKETDLIWDFSDLNQLLQEYVDGRTEKDDHYYAGYEFFGAGMGDGLHGLGHQAIEKAALQGIFNEETQLKIYLGNWMRDFSQFVDPMVVRPMANALDRISEEYKASQNRDKPNMTLDELKAMMKENRVEGGDSSVPIAAKDVRTIKLPVGFSITEARIDWEPTALSPVRISRAGITTLVEMLAIKEFGELKSMVGKTGDETDTPPNYMKYLKDFRKKYLEITPAVLGVYRPEEHMDNPAALIPEAGTKANLNFELDNAFVKDPIAVQFENSAFGTKNYIRGNKAEPFPSAYDCFLKYINSAMTQGPGNIKRYTDLGAAFHVLEDLYAHSNFSEIAVMKVYDPEVFPWYDLPAGCKKGTLKEHKSPSSKNSHTGRASVVGNRSNVKFDTLRNPELWPEPLKRFMKLNPTKKPEDYYSSISSSATTDRGLYYSHAECAPLLTGSFGRLDTIASIAPKINNKIFSIEVKPIDKVKEGERSFADSLIYEMLRDISQAQDADEKEKNPNYKGKGDGKYAELFQQYLLLRDAYVAKNWYQFGYSWSDVLSGFGIIDFVMDYVKVIQSVLYHMLSLTAINLIDDYQTLELQQLKDLENGTWRVGKNGPTHTQLAKDNGIQPLHYLAVHLATNAVYKIASKVDKVWKGDPSAKAEVLALAEDFFRHPVQTAWADKLVYEWCTSNLVNETRVKIAHEASIAIYGIYQGHREMQEMFDDLYKLNYWNAPEKINDPNNAFRILYEKQTSKWHEVQQKLFDVWKSDKFAESFKISGKSETLNKNTILEEIKRELDKWVP